MSLHGICLLIMFFINIRVPDVLRHVTHAHAQHILPAGMNASGGNVRNGLEEKEDLSDDDDEDGDSAVIGERLSLASFEEGVFIAQIKYSLEKREVCCSRTCQPKSEGRMIKSHAQALAFYSILQPLDLGCCVHLAWVLARLLNGTNRNCPIC